MFCALNKLIRPANNERGAALVLGYMVLTVVFTLTTGLALSNVTELNSANRYRNTTSAFWAAEAGINRYISDTAMLNSDSQLLSIGNTTVLVSKDDTQPGIRLVTAEGFANGSTRTIRATFPANAPGAFDNTLSAGGNLTFNFFLLAFLDINQKTRLTGTYSQSGFGFGGGQLEDLVEGVDPGLTTLTYPDADNNGTPDEFGDFKAYNQQILSTYDPDDVVYITQDSSVNILPSSNLVGKKILYVEGSAPGTGDVNIYFDTTWAANQNLTVISTGSVNYIQPLSNPSSNSQLNTISWDDYNEGSVFLSAHSGVNYTHDDANYGSIVALSVTSGSVIANDDVTANFAAVVKRFNYENPMDEDGNVPPGFEGLVGIGGGGYSSTPSDWQEI
jgi:hypothetical protein